MTPVDRNRSMPNEEHLKNNPYELNPYEILNGPEYGVEGDLATKFAYCWTLQKFGLITGSNNRWAGPTMEYLESNELFFRFHACDSEQLRHGHIIITNRNEFETIAKCDFIPVCEGTIHNWNGKSIKNSTWLTNSTLKTMIEIEKEAIEMECKVTQDLCDKVQECKNETKVRMIYFYLTHI